MEHLPYENGLRELGAVQSGEMAAPGRPESSLSISKGGLYKKEGDRPFSRVCCDRKWGNGFQLNKGKFRLVMWKKSFMIRVVKYQN